MAILPTETLFLQHWKNSLGNLIIVKCAHEFGRNLFLEVYMEDRGNRNSWKDVELLGSGGQGKVFKVIDTRAPDKFAKTLETLAIDFQFLSAERGHARAQQKAREVAENLRQTIT